MFLSPSPIGYAVCDTARKAGFDVDNQDPAPLAMRWASEEARVTPAIEGDLRPIWGPRRKEVAPALGGVGDLADMASIRVHREDGALGPFKIQVAAKDDQTVGGSSASARALLVLLASPTLSRLFTSSTTATQRPNNADEDKQHYDDPQTPGKDGVSAPPAPLRGLLLGWLLLLWCPWGTSIRLRWRRNRSIRLRRRYPRR